MRRALLLTITTSYSLDTGNLFHVVFEFTAEAQGLFNTVEKLEMPILVKSIDLPSYSIDVQTHNQYNRQVQTHHKISYNPVNVAFHDDVKELITKSLAQVLCILQC